MVLLVHNRFLPVSPTNLAEFYTQYPHLLAGAEHLASRVPVKVDTTGILYVRQKQWAATQPGDTLDNGQEVVACATEDLLTCHAVILRDPATAVVAIGHFDEFSRVWDFSGLMADFLEKVKKVKQRDDWDYCEEDCEGDWEWWEEEEDEEDDSQGQTCDVQLQPDVVYELHLLGGYADEARRGHKLTQRFFKHLHDLPIRLEIVTCCLGSPNTKKVEGQSQPIISGVHVDILTGKISPVVFNRTFTDFESGIRDVLMTFPPLFKNKSSLRKMISKQEDRGFAKSKSVKGYDNEVRRY